MDKTAAIDQIRDVCDTIAKQLARIHPAVPHLGDSETQNEIYKAVFELTKQLESIKKRVMKLAANAKDESPLT